MEAALAHAPDDLAFQDVLARHLAAATDPEVRDGATAVRLATRGAANPQDPLVLDHGDLS